MTGKGRRADIHVRGPGEVRRVATAFRAMQTRLMRVMEDHTQALIAVSHDLRTPIQRMRLRASLLRDGEARDAMTADLADMEKFIGSVTAFIESGTDEEPRLVDLAAIAMTIVDNASDVGARIEYDGPDSMPMRLKSLAMKRALGNLVENACRHADRVQVVLRAGERIRISVEDDGPGIPSDRREEVFLPFHRIGGSGSGLGLAIVRNAVTKLEGDATLGRSGLGGLSATITLPQVQADQPGGGTA
jgi:two-component system osmolarity sensor histidine kinase EnvZ